MEDLKPKVKPYEGDRGFIFISYSHRDKERVYPIIDQLNKDGYRVWYDDGIAPGSEWPESIAMHLDKSSVCFAFISENYLNSYNCKREVNYALQKKKPFVSVFLEEVRLSPGMELQLSTTQSVFRYLLPSEGQFFAKLYDTDALRDCREATLEEPIPVPEPTAPVKPEPKPVPDSVKEIKKPKKIKEKSGSAKSGSKKKVGLIIIAAVVLLLATIVVGSLLRTVSISDEKIKIDDERLSLKDKVITSKDIKQIWSLKKLYSLEFVNCTFEDGLFGNNVPASADEIYAVTIESCKGITDGDWAKLSSLSHVGHLKLIDCDLDIDRVNAIQFLKFSRLDNLELDGNKGIVTLRGIADIADQLFSLSVSGTNIVDFSEFASKGERLDKIEANNCNLTSFKGLEHALALTSISASKNQLTSLEGLKNCTRLKKVELGGNKNLTDIGPLIKSAKTLQYVDLNNTKVSDISGLSKTKKLEHLEINQTGLSSLSALGNPPALQTILAENNKLKNLDGITQCPKLQYIDVSKNQISAIEKADWADNVSLDLSHNQLSDITFLQSAAKTYTLRLDDNPIKSYESLKKVSEAWLAVNYSKAFAYDALNYNMLYNLYIVGCPLDCQLDLKDELGAALTFVDSSSELDAMKENNPFEKS